MLAAAGVAIAALGGSALVSYSHASARLTAGADSDSLTDAGALSFDPSDAGAAVQTAGYTLINNGTTPIPIRNVTVTVKSGQANPWRVTAVEDCDGATIPPGGYCVASVQFTRVNVGLTGTIVVTAGDGSIHETTISTDVGDDEMTVDPLQVDYGSLNVGTTSAARQITVGAAPEGAVFEPMSIAGVNALGKPAAGSDYHVASDACTGHRINLPQEGETTSQTSCQIGETATPGAAGSRPAFLDVASCDPFSFNFGPPPGGGSEVPLPPPAAPPGQELICGQGDGPTYAQHLLVGLTAVGIPPRTPPPANPFAPTLIANPAVAPAGRTTQVTGTGFPDNTTVTLGLVPTGTAPTVNLATVPGVFSLTTNGIGGFVSQPMLIMPHTTPGQYEILAQAPGATAIAAFLVAPGNQEPPKFITRH